MANALKKAFPVTVPVLLGYLFVGMAFGMLLQERGYGFVWAFFISLTVYAGSMQFVMLSFLSYYTGLYNIALMTLAVNFRHVFYGISMLEKFKGSGRKKLYMIFSLTDETYSLLCSGSVPPGVDPHLYRFCVAMLNQIYWITGSVVGALAGAVISFNTQGIDFAMTALFATIFIDQWQSYPTHAPALIGLAAALLALLVLGPDSFVIPALLVIACVLLMFRERIVPAFETREERGKERDG